MIAVKENQPSLLKGIKDTIASGCPDDSYESFEDKRKGRKERRQCSLWRDCSRIPKGWTGLKNILHIRSSGERDGKLYQEDRYYISSVEQSKNYDAKKFAEAIRLHWQIENNLHRELDVVFLEDTTKLPSKDVQRKFSLFRKMSVNIYRLNGFRGLKYAVESFLNRVDKLFDLLKFRT